MSEEPRNAMEGRARRRASPAGTGIRTKAVRVETEPPPTKRHELGTRVAVVYYLCRNYLCRNHHLEDPHFMEVPLASPQGLYLRDVICRLDALRGKGMAAKYSWSRKRSYKNGFVWHDLSLDDLLLPTEGTEYVLKGSKILFDQSKPPLPIPDHQQNSTTNNSCIALLPFSGASSPSPNKPVAAHDAATQTDGGENNAKLQRRQDTQERPEIAHESRFMPPPAGEYPRSRRSGTLQSLIRAEAAGRRRGLLVLEEDEKATTGSITISGRPKPVNLLMRMRLMACGPVQTSYKPRFTQLQYPLSLELFTLGALKPGTTSASTVRALLHDRK